MRTHSRNTMAGDEQHKPGWRERRKEAKRAKAERTGDTLEKRAERSRTTDGATVKDAAERAGLIGWVGGYF